MPKHVSSCGLLKLKGGKKGDVKYRSLYSCHYCEKKTSMVMYTFCFVFMVWWVIRKVFEMGVNLCKVNFEPVIKDVVRRVFLTCVKSFHFVITRLWF